MARIRTIKPEFWTDEDLSELSAENHMFAAALLNHSDDEGFFKANPKLLHAQIFPLRELSGTVTVFIQQLENIGFLRLFIGSDGKQYGRVINFLKHQTINKPKPSKIKALEPIPDEYGSDTGRVPVGKEQGTGNREQEITAAVGGDKIFENHPTQRTPENHPVRNWEPSQMVFDEFKRFRIPVEFITEQIGQFKTFWAGRHDEYLNYDAKFISSVLGSWKRIGHTWKKSPEPQHDEDPFAGWNDLATDDTEGEP